MKLKQFMLGTTALIGAGVLFTGMALPAAAQEEAREAQGEVTAGGYPNIEISGFARFRAHGGELDDQRTDSEVSRELDFSNDTEVHVILDAVSEQTGLEYGGTIEFEADTSREDNTDETWLFLSGGFGEVRLGDEDGVADNSMVGASTIAAGTGGIDGSVIDSLSLGSNVFLTNSDDATKIRYYTPSFGGLTLAASYTPQQAELNDGGENGDTVAGVDVQAQNIVDAGIVYEGEFGGFGITASVVGITGDLKNVDVDDDGEDDDIFGDGSWYGWMAGLSTEIFGFKLAGSFADEKVGDVDRTFFTAGLGYEIGPVNTSVTYSQVLDSTERFADNGQEVGDQSNLVFSATYALAPGLTLDGDVALFDNDLSGEADDDGEELGDQGWSAVGRLALAF